jgi:hypothetical protein
VQIFGTEESCKEGGNTNANVMLMKIILLHHKHISNNCANEVMTNTTQGPIWWKQSNKQNYEDGDS